MHSYYNSCFLKEECCYRNNCSIRLHDGDLEHCLVYFLLPIYSDIHSGIPGLDLEILKILILVCFRDALQPADY